MRHSFPRMPLDNPDITAYLAAVLEKYSSGLAIRRYEASGHRPDADLWRELVRGGWTALCLPEDLGGSGRPLSDMQLTLYELGYAAAPVPYRSSVVLVAGFLATEATAEPAAEIVAAVAQGQIWAPAVTEASWLQQVTTRFDGRRVSGRKVFVPDAGAANSFLVLAVEGDGTPAWVAVDAADEGITTVATPNSGNDAQCIVDLQEVQARRVVGAPIARWAALERFTSASWALGLMARALEMAVDHAKGRVQFGRPIGTFQAVQHRLADSAIELQAIVNMGRSIALAIDEAGLDDVLVQATVAEFTYAARRTAVRVGRDSHQILGGLGYSLEHDLHLYTRRIKAFSLLGDLDDVLTEEIAAFNEQQLPA